MLASGFGVWGICAGLVSGHLTLIAFRLWLGRKLVAMSARHWLARVFAPIAAISAATLAVGRLPCLAMAQGFWRVAVTTAACEAVFIPLSWFVVLSKEERTVVASKLRAIVGFKARNQTPGKLNEEDH